MTAPSPAVSRSLAPQGMRWALPAALLVGGAMFLTQRLSPDGLGDGVQRWAEPMLSLLSAVVFLHRSRQPGEPASGWQWFALAWVYWPISLALGEFVPSPLWRGLLIGLVAPMLALGLVRWFDQGFLWAGGLRRLLEGLIFALSLLTLAWGSVLQLAGIAPKAAWLNLMTNVAVFGMLLGITIFLARVDPRRLLGPLGWVGLHFLASMLVNVAALRAQLQGAYGPSHWSAQALPSLFPLMTLAAFAPWTRDALTREEGRGQNLWGVALVYFPVALAMLWLLVSLLLGTAPDPIHVGMAALLALILLARQVIAHRDQASFFRILQSQLDHRTRSLEEHQTILMRNHQMNLMATMGAGLAHDFNNLLQVVIQESEQGHSEGAMEAAKKASALAHQLMNLSRLESRSLELFELGALVEARLPLFQKLCPKSLSLSLWREPEECWMEADPVQLEQVLLNLVTNARDALQGPGFIRIRLRKLASGQALLEVEDSGPGMDEGVKGRLFQPFFTTKEPGRGTGLGLASVKAIVESVGGTVDVITEVGLGTTFRLRFPTVDVD